MRQILELITIKFRTLKSAGKVKLRFRLRDGRNVDIYHRSDIEVDISLMDKLTLEGNKKKGVSTLNPKLLSNIAEEKGLMSRAYAQMKMLQTFFNELENTDEIAKSPFRKLGRERKKAVMRTMYDEPIFLRKEELLKIMKKKVSASLQDTKDAFLVQCALGCRISDFQMLNMDSIAVSSTGIPYVHYIPSEAVSLRERLMWT